MLRGLLRCLKEEGGNAAIIFALSAIPITFAAGTAIDYGRASTLRAKLQAVTDSVTLSLCKMPAATSTATLQSTAQANIQSYFPSTTTITVDPLQITSNPRQITATSHASYATLIARIGRIDAIPLTSSATCSAQETYFEIALSVDNTGSMSQSSGTQSKIEALKAGAKAFVDYMFTNGALPGHVKIALVPFAASAAVDPITYRNATWIDQAAKSSLHWQNVTIPPGYTYNRFDGFNFLKGVNASWGWAGCLESLPYPFNTQDVKPDAAKPDSYYLPMFAPDEAGNGGQSSHTETSSGLVQNYANSYLNDVSGQSFCNTTAPDDKTRMGNACKYMNPTGATSTSGRGPNFMCTARPLTRMTTDKNKLDTEIGYLTANGNTNIHEGFMWGWRTISPNSVFADGTAYTQPNTLKVVVLMTDGVNTWSVNPATGGGGGNNVVKSAFTAYGYVQNQNGSTANTRLSPTKQITVASPTEQQARDAMDQLTLEACSNARAKGVIIYTVGFSVPAYPIDGQGLQLLRDCAASQERSFVATSDLDLVNKFKLIAQGIGNLRLVR